MLKYSGVRVGFVGTSGSRIGTKLAQTVGGTSPWGSPFSPRENPAVERWKTLTKRQHVPAIRNYRVLVELRLFPQPLRPA
jgi:hypothetical protein